MTKSARPCSARGIQINYSGCMYSQQPWGLGIGHGILVILLTLICNHKSHFSCTLIFQSLVELPVYSGFQTHVQSLVELPVYSVSQRKCYCRDVFRIEIEVLCRNLNT